MSTPGPSTQALPNSPLSFPRFPSDEIFHFAPFLTLDQHTISPVYHSPAGIHKPVDQHQISHDHGVHSLSSPNLSYSKIRDDVSQSLDDSGKDDFGDDDPSRKESDGMCHIVPKPRNSREAYLLTEIIHHNTLVLQYNKEVLERTQDDRREAERFVGQVRFLIRKSGQTAAFEYAMQEDHSPPSTSEQPYPSFDVDLT